MDDDPSGVEGYSFDEFFLIPQERRLLKLGEPIPLHPKCFDLCTVLVARAGNVISKRELLETVWPNCNVQEQNIPQQISALRKALGQIQNSAPFIETVSKTGYRFCREVKEHRKLEANSSIRRAVASEWAERINSKFPDAKVYGLVHELPKIVFLGELEVSKEINRASVAIAKELRSNSTVALVDDEPNLISEPVIFQAKTVKYSTLCELRHLGTYPFTLTANVLLICKEKRMLILDVRSQKIHHFPGGYHVFGGYYQDESDSGDLRATAFREVSEETKSMGLIKPNSEPMLLLLEKTNKTFQVTFLGANISADVYERLEKSWESDEIRKISFDKLKMNLEIENVWVPSCKAAILAWLACGAPGTEENEKFGGLTPVELVSCFI